jgi:TolB-like protein/Flp pilus assembly protein TadD
MRYIFAGYAIDTKRRELRCGADLVSLEPQVFDLLVYLIQNRERVVTKEDLFGAIWNGRLVSESALTTRINAARKAVGDSGYQQRLIKTFLRKGVRFVGLVQEEQDPKAAVGRDPASAPALPDRASIAVLPFTNMSGDAEQDYFADGITEEIITALSQFRLLFVVARNSTYAYKGRAVDVKQLGGELGVRYVLEGSVRKAANRIRITAQLIDTKTGVHLWANRFDGVLKDIFDLQDQVTASVVGLIAPKLEQAEIERAKRKPTDRLDAYDYYLRGIASLYQWTKDSIGEALRLFQKAIQIDSEFASAYGMAAYCYLQRKSYGWLVDRSQEIAECERLARRAAELGRDDAMALTKASHSIAYVAGDVESGLRYIDQALQLNPNLAAAWYVSGWLRVFRGEPEVALEHLAHALRLSPFDPPIFRVHAGIAYAHFFAGRYEDASTSAEIALRSQPNYLTALRGAAAIQALAGRLDEAQKTMARIRELDPALRLSNLGELMPFRRAEDFGRWAEGLRKAGLPEH